MSTETQPSIAELWGQFYPYAAGILSFWGTVSDAHPDKARAEALRTQLIERCKRVDESGGYYTLFTLDEFVIAVHCKPNGAPKHRREDSSETAREMSAAYAFWAWELEQRQKEVSNG